MTTTFAVRNVSLTDWETIKAIAPAMHQSRLFGVSSAEQAAAIMLKGYELGLGLAASFELIYVIQGKPTLSPRGALALIHRSGELTGMSVDGDATRCTVTMKRRSGFEQSVTYTVDDAKRAGLVKPDSAWAAYPANMLRWRAIGFCADLVFPDVLGGLKRADELGAAITEAGDVIEGQAITPDPRYLPELPPVVIAPLNLESLVETFGAEAVMAANSGKIPATYDELETIARQLVNGAAQ